MIELLADQSESDRLFRQWAGCLIKGSTTLEKGWVIEGRGFVFNNYGHGSHGTIQNQVMLGVDPRGRSGVVKIVQPDVSQQDRGKLTAIGRNGRGSYLLRRGWLRKIRFRASSCMTLNA